MRLDLLCWGGGRLNSSDGSFVVIALLCSIGDGGGIALLCSMLSERGASGFYKGIEAYAVLCLKPAIQYIITS